MNGKLQDFVQKGIEYISCLVYHDESALNAYSFEFGRRCL